MSSKRAVAQVGVHLVACHGDEVGMGVDAFFAAQLGGEGDVGQLGGAVLQGVFGKGGFHGQGLAFAAYLGVVYFHFRAGTQIRECLACAAVADEDEVLQYGWATGVAALLLPLLSHSIRQSQS